MTGPRTGRLRNCASITGKVKKFSLLQRVHTITDFHPRRNKKVLGALPKKVKQPELDDDHSFAFSVESKASVAANALIFMHKHKFTATLTFITAKLFQFMYDGTLFMTEAERKRISGRKKRCFHFISYILQLRLINHRVISLLFCLLSVCCV